MPFQYVPPKKGRRKVTFWIRSSRGTNQARTFSIPVGWDKDTIKAELEEWCSQFGAWHVSENCVSYGWYDGERDTAKEK